MLIQQHSGGNGFGYGFGAAGLTKGKDYNCNASICYAIGAANDTLFKKLQQNLNVLSGVGGFPQLVVDGFIGKDTLAALVALKKIGFNPSAYSTYDAIAANAQTLVDTLAGLATIQQTMAIAAGQPSPLRPAGTAVAYQPPTSSGLPVMTAQVPGGSSVAAMLPKMKSKTLWWIAGGLAAALTVGGVGYVVYRRKGR